MPYTLHFSDPTKADTVLVPDMPPGINAIDTSLSLVGKGYPNYGIKYAENFLRLLENFASPSPPQNPIEGQLWYDTSNQSNKVLRIMDGTAQSTRWPNANGIYQQGYDPRETNVVLKIGDIWVDTINNQIKIFNSNDWTLVGPQSVSTITGSVPEQIFDVLNVSHWVIKNYVDSVVVSVVASETFTPKLAIPGFLSLQRGVNVINSGIFDGTASAAQSLSVNDYNYSAATFLRKDDKSAAGQVITGKVVFQTPEVQSGAQGRDGVVINTGVTNEYSQFYKLGNDAVLLNYKTGGKIVFQTKTGLGNALGNVLTIDNKTVGINTSTTAASPALDVFGTTRVSSTLSVTTTASNAISTPGGMIIGRDLAVAGNLTVAKITATTLTVGPYPGQGTAIETLSADTYDIGSPAKPFRQVHASIIGSTGSIIYGTIKGTANGLSASTTFKLQGQVTATSFLFQGTGTQATFTATLTRSAITDQPILTGVQATAGTLTLLVLNTATNTSVLQQVSKRDFLSDISLPGMMVAYGGVEAPDGWLLCDGNQYTTVAFPALYSVIGQRYGGDSGSFKVPNYSTSTNVDAYTLNYIIKT
jgi:hypothetical protein